MPELPEVEVTRLGFAKAISNATVVRVRMGKPLRWPLGVHPDTLVGQQVLAVRRRGKYLLLDLSEGLLLVHLGMSGSLRFAVGLPPAGTHDHFDLETTAGTLRLHDPRRFGAVVYAASAADPIAVKLLGHLGVEPFSDEFTPTQLHRGLAGRRAPIKQILLMGEIVVGVGNIYASESLFLAGIRPTTSAHRITKPKAQKLHAAVVQVLEQAVQQGGSSLRDFTGVDGNSGYFQRMAHVYDRAGLPCRVCQTTIKGLRQGQRSSYYCPTCQKP